MMLPVLGVGEVHVEVRVKAQTRREGPLPANRTPVKILARTHNVSTPFPSFFPFVVGDHDTTEEETIINHLYERGRGKGEGKGRRRERERKEEMERGERRVKGGQERVRARNNSQLHIRPSF